MTTKLIDTQAERMHRLTKELLRKYQLRDRNEIICCGVSISQCYALDILGDHGEMTMQSLAQKMFLDKSTTSRIADPLVQRKLVSRRFDDADRRIIMVGLTAAGAKLLGGMRSSQIDSQRQILERVSPAQRRQLIESLEILSNAVHDWLATCCVPQKVQLRTKPEGNNHHD